MSCRLSSILLIRMPLGGFSGFEADFRLGREGVDFFIAPNVVKTRIKTSRGRPPNAFCWIGPPARRPNAVEIRCQNNVRQNTFEIMCQNCVRPHAVEIRCHNSVRPNAVETMCQNDVRLNIVESECQNGVRRNSIGNLCQQGVRPNTTQIWRHNGVRPNTIEIKCAVQAQHHRIIGLRERCEELVFFFEIWNGVQ